MVNEVNKLIYNTLVVHRAVFLPDVGTLRVVRYSAHMSSKNELIPPRYTIEYSSDKLAKSLIDIISTEADIDITRAEEIYQRWLEKVREGSVVTIDRVGTLRDKSFAVDSDFVRALNISSKPISLPRKRKFAPIFISIIIIATICAGGWWYYIHTPNSTDIPVEIVIEEPIVPVVEIALVEEEIQPEIEVAEDVEVVENLVEDWRENEDIRHWVVVGSYSTTENAERAISDILKRTPELQCDYIRLGSMYAVAVFGSEDVEACQEFKQEHKTDFPQSWIYTPKRFR